MEETKVLYTLRVDGYEPEICDITMPLLERYSRKIGAKFHVIADRKLPQLPPVMEKFQIWDLAHHVYQSSDWHIFFDADTLIHPNFWDVTAILSKDTTASFGTDFVPMRFRPNHYFLRDGRFIGKGNWCAIASNWCLDYWAPPPGFASWEDVVPLVLASYAASISPTQDEVKSGVIESSHLLDDYFVSLNIARFGLKHFLIPDLAAHFKADVGLLWHQYLMGADQKVVMMRDMVKKWGVELDGSDDNGGASCAQ